MNAGVIHGVFFIAVSTLLTAAAHTFLQHVDYAKTGSETALREELSRLTEQKFLTPRQAESIDLGCILRLFASPIAYDFAGIEKIQHA